jgi:U32 family peptidase
VNSGADAVYFGLSDFNARARAANFAPEELPHVMGWLHERGAQGFVTFNTLVFDEELARADAALRAIVESDVDAVIVQDLGIVRRLRAMSPDIPIHGSTQMTVTSAQGAEVVAAMGVERVVLARELTAADIRKIAEETQVELEVFVHGAMCVSYSGQCFSSEAWGGRSANRGQCAQACRLPYDLIVDGQVRDLRDVKYLLSPQDLMGANQIEELVDAGVSCFKIEGRLKGAEYVALTTRTYRQAVDAAWAGHAARLGDRELHDLNMVFSRGFAPGFLAGVRHQELVKGRYPRHRGVLLGHVESVTSHGVHLRLEGPVKPGDGVVFDAGRPQEEEAGGSVWEVFAAGGKVEGESTRGSVELRFARNFRLDDVSVGNLVWKNRDPALEARIQSELDASKRRIKVVASVSGAAGGPLTLTLRAPDGTAASATSGVDLAPASKHGLRGEKLRAGLNKLGDTTLRLGDIENALEGDLFLPKSALNDVRRRAAQGLTDALRERRRWHLGTASSESDSGRSDGGGGATGRPASVGEAAAEVTAAEPAVLSALRAPRLTVLCRTVEQAAAVCEVDAVGEVQLDFLELKGLRAAVDVVQGAGRKAVVAAPRVLKPKEERIWRFLLGLGPDAILVRGLGLLHTLTALTDAPVPPLYGDFSLNAANADTVDFLLNRGLSRLAPTHDLNAPQLCHLARGGHAASLELIVHHHLPVFHTEHCVFCRFMSSGDNRSNCGEPCERHDVRLRDLNGRDHVVLADMGCRNTVFNAEAQSGASHLPDFLQAGYRLFRIELLDQPASAVAPLLDHYHRALDGQLAAPALWQWLRDSSPRGVTLGSLVVSPEQRRLKPTAR